MKENVRSSASIWTEGDIRWILPARLAALLGSSALATALLLTTEGAGRGAVGVALLMAAVTLPVVLTIGWTGRLADTRDSRQLLLAATAVQLAGLAGLVAAVRAPGPGDGSEAFWWWLTLGTVALVQTGHALELPVWPALTAKVVGDERIGDAMAWQQGLGVLAAPAGALLGAFTYSLGGVVAAAGITALCALAGGVAALAIRTRRGGGAATHPLATDAIAESEDAEAPPTVSTLRWLVTHPVLGPIFWVLTPLVLVGEAVNVVEVLLARQELGASAAQYGWGEVAFGAGAVIGTWGVRRVTSDAARLARFVGGFWVVAVLILVAGVVPSWWWYVGLAVPIGAGNMAANVSSATLLMLHTPEARRGRVQAAFVGTVRAFSLGALAIGGLLGSALGPRGTYVACGTAACLVMLAGSVWLHRAHRAARPSGRRPRRAATVVP